jgi:Tfp pilus assembly protein PilV
MLLEVLLACSLLVIGSLTLASLATSIRPLAKHGNNELQAILVAKEGIDAVRSIRDNDFNLLIDGTHGIALTASGWGFSGASDTANGFTRTLLIEPFDVRTKKITSTVTHAHASSTLTTVLVDIDQDLGMAHYVTFDLSGGSLNNGNKELNGMIIGNVGFTPITIAFVTAWWGDDSLMQTVKLGSNVWTHNGTGTPNGKQPSGTLLDIVDFTLAGGQSEDTTAFTFNGPVDTVNFVVKFTFTDGTHAYVTIQPE